MSSAVGKKKLRSGYTTGTCAAAAAKGAALTLLGHAPDAVSVSLPFGGKASIVLEECRKHKGHGYAAVVKDAGDDPDVTNGAVIGAELSFISAQGNAARGSMPVMLHGGKGVGLVTKPGLPVRKGGPAINPVPRAMIRRAIREAIAEAGGRPRSLKAVDVTIFVPDGEALAQKTFNPRLGILGGISILGTTGIVKPFSHQAYKETIALALNIARASGCTEVVLSTGGRSERLAAARVSSLRGESFIQMGDYVGFSLEQALNRGFRCITVAAFLGKLTKIAAGATHTHAGNFPLEMSFVAALGERLRLSTALLRTIERAVTMRGVLELLLRHKSHSLIDAICKRAIGELYAMTGGKGTISVLLFSFDGRMLWYGGKEGRREGIG
jgi:cobalt-precorrin-5B (C1)-methyltransferase